MQIIYDMTKNILHRKIIHEVDQSYSYSTDTPFTMPLHCHAEYELIYILSGKGQAFIGDSVKYYDAGDLILIGNNTPHLHLCDSIIDKSIKQKSICDILHFPNTIFPINLSEIQEYSFVNLVLGQSLHGVKFNSQETISLVLKIMKTINKKQGIDRIIALFKILDLLGKSNDITLISPTPHYSNITNQKNNEPINKVFTYLTTNFKEEITLNAVADYVKLNPASLCRYFKQITGKTLFEYLNSIRIEHACRLMSHSNLTISQIAYEVGFNNLSHFNKRFKLVTNQTPTEYKRHIAIQI